MVIVINKIPMEKCIYIKYMLKKVIYSPSSVIFPNSKCQKDFFYRYMPRVSRPFGLSNTIRDVEFTMAQWTYVILCYLLYIVVKYFFCMVLRI
jgi:hypothetical protein